MGGTIDRVDVYTSPSGERYVRVIDYKTGKKAFHLADALYGLNMQMLVYLAALVEHSPEAPAGILYMPAAEPSVSVERGAGEEKIKEEADKQLKMSGVILSDQEIIQAMEAGARGKFIPASLNKDGSLGRYSSTLDREGLQTVLAYVKRVVATMGEALLEGRVELDRYFEEQAGYAGLLKSWLASTCAWDRILYGTDWPIVNLGEYIGFIQRLAPERHWEAVFFENANRVYGLGL